MGISIRLATEEDIPALREMIPAAVRRHSVGFYTPRQIESAIKYIFGVDTQLIVDRTYYVAEAGGEIVGCGGWSKRQTLFGGDQWKEKTDPLLDPTRDPGRIRAFFVHPKWGRRGIGRRIMKEIVGRFIDGGRKLYAVYRSNGKSITPRGGYGIIFALPATGETYASTLVLNKHGGLIGIAFAHCADSPEAVWAHSGGAVVLAPRRC